MELVGEQHLEATGVITVQNLEVVIAVLTENRICLTRDIGIIQHVLLLHHQQEDNVEIMQNQAACIVPDIHTK